MRAGLASRGANFGKRLNNSAALALLGTYSTRRGNKARGEDAVLPWAAPHPKMLRKMGRRGVKPPDTSGPVPGRMGTR